LIIFKFGISIKERHEVGYLNTTNLPGTLSGGTRKLIQDTITNIPKYNDLWNVNE